MSGISGVMTLGQLQNERDAARMPYSAFANRGTRTEEPRAAIMSAPFTMFACYNAAIWPAQIAAYFLGLAVVASLALKRLHATRFILSALALMWLWNGIGY